MRDGGDTGRSGARRVLAAFTVSLAGSLGFVAAYLTGAGTQLLGLAIAAALAGLGVGLGLWSRVLMPRQPAEEERPDLEPPVEEERATASTFVAGERAVGRRRLLGRLLAAVAAALGVALLWPARSLGPRPGRALLRTAWEPGTRIVDGEGRPVTVDRLDTGGALTVFPEGHVGSSDAQTMLLRVGPEGLRPQPGREDWSPEGYIAYSKVCTHAGCAVGLYSSDAFVLLCPCHQATFDVLDGAKPLFGPGPRPLPQLPLHVDGDGNLVARGDFSGVVGPGFWQLG